MTDLDNQVPLYVLSHRLPVEPDPADGWRRSPGGLISALGPALATRRTVWFGHCATTDLGQKNRPEFEGNQLTIVPIPLTKAEQRDAIDGFSNQTLWPALHGIDGYIEQSPDWWTAYQDRNKKAALVIAGAAAADATVWVHDYQHFGVARTLRQVRPDLKIGLFCHTPFDDRCMRAITESRILADQLRAHHFIGTQTSRDADALRRYLSTSNDSCLPTIRDIPVGFNVAAWLHYRSDSRVLDAAAKHAAPGGTLAVGIDRLDYTKGIPHKLLAIETLLCSGHLDPNKFRLIQVAVPTRSSIVIYEALRHLTRDISDRINGRFARRDGLPVVDLRVTRMHPYEVAGLMRAADMAIVTPARDGMNLVSLEFSAINGDRPTDLILSAGTGSADYLGPWSDIVDGKDVLSIATAINDGLRRRDVDRAERSRRRCQAASGLQSAAWTCSLWEHLAQATDPSSPKQPHQLTSQPERSLALLGGAVFPGVEERVAQPSAPWF